MKIEFERRAHWIDHRQADPPEHVKVSLRDVVNERVYVLSLEAFGAVCVHVSVKSIFVASLMSSNMNVGVY